MPDSNVFRDAVRRSAFGYFSEFQNLTDIEITRRIADRQNTHDPSDTFKILNYVRGARREHNDGRAADTSPDPTRPYVPTARDPSLEGEIATFQYRTVVVIYDPETGDRYSTVVMVPSTSPLSPDEIRRAAMEGWTTVRGPNREYYDRDQLSPDWQQHVIITGAGRA